MSEATFALSTSQTGLIADLIGAVMIGFGAFSQTTKRISQSTQPRYGMNSELAIDLMLANNDMKFGTIFLASGFSLQVFGTISELSERGNLSILFLLVFLVTIYCITRRSLAYQSFICYLAKIDNVKTKKTYTEVANKWLAGS